LTATERGRRQEEKEREKEGEESSEQREQEDAEKEEAEVSGHQEQELLEEDAGDEDSEELFDADIPVDKENPRRCVDCGKEFQNHFAVKLHYQNVHLRLLHRCTVDGCNAAFPSKRSRDRHSSNLALHRKLLSTTGEGQEPSELLSGSAPAIAGGPPPPPLLSRSQPQLHHHQQHHHHPGLPPPPAVLAGDNNGGGGMAVAAHPPLHHRPHYPSQQQQHNMTPYQNEFLARFLAEQQQQQHHQQQQQQHPAPRFPFPFLPGLGPPTSHGTGVPGGPNLQHGRFPPPFGLFPFGPLLGEMGRINPGLFAAKAASGNTDPASALAKSNMEENLRKYMAMAGLTAKIENH
jgi:hypothetical protein